MDHERAAQVHDSFKLTRDLWRLAAAGARAHRREAKACAHAGRAATGRGSALPVSLACVRMGDEMRELVLIRADSKASFRCRGNFLLTTHGACATQLRGTA